MSNKLFPPLPSLSRQLLIRCAGVLLVGTVLTEALAFHAVKKGLENQIQSRASTITETLEFTTEGLLDPQNRTILQRVVQNYATLPAVIEVAILDPNMEKLAHGSVLLQTRPLAWSQTPALLEQLKQAAQTGIPFTINTQVAGKAALIQVLPFSSTVFATAGKRGMAVAVMDRERINAEVTQLWLASAVVMTGGVVLLLLVIGWLINRWVLDPIAELQQQMRDSQISGRFQVPLTLHRNEILYLAETYDQVFWAGQEALAQLQQTNIELARATQLKDEFLANMSHELRTPLNAILGMSECCQDGIYGDFNPQQLHAIATIHSSGSHLLELITGILDIAKIQSGKMELEIAPNVVAELCHSCLTLIQPLADKKQITLIKEVPPHLEPIEADGRMLRQVILNLLSNAVKFTPNGGKVWLRVQEDPSTDVNSPYLQFQVIDTGIGIEPQHLSTIFESFVQVDGRYNRQYTGTGLGLTLVKQMTELHGGSVAVTSTVGEGSCFTIHLPYRRSLVGQASLQSSQTIETSQDQNGLTFSMPTPPNSGAAPDAAPVTLPLNPNFYLPAKSALILIAEDNLASFDTFSEYLMMKGYELMHAQDGEEAVQMTQEYQPDLVLMDIQMPKLSGFEAIQQLRSIPKFQQLPIIALTALASAGERERCLAAGANEYLSKPLKLRHLLEVVQQQLATHSLTQVGQ